jgi:hypothetical protein
MFLFNILFIGYYLHAPFYSSVFQSCTFPVSSSDYQSSTYFFLVYQLPTYSFLFFCLLVIYILCFFFWLSFIIYMFLCILLFISYLLSLFIFLSISHLHSLFLLLILSHYLHVPLYSVYQSLSTQKWKFPGVTRNQFSQQSERKTSLSGTSFRNKTNARHHCQEPVFATKRT